MTTQLALPLAVLGFLLLALGLPAARMRVRHGQWGVVLHRRADPFQAIMGAAMATALVAVAVGALLYGARGPEALGVWSLPDAVTGAGWVLAWLGFALTALAQHQMGRSWRVGIDDRPTELVERGIFAVIRNPIYSGMLATVAGIVLIAPCAWTLCLWLGTLLLLSLQTRLEERHLEALHGASWRRYAARVGRFLPGIGKGSGESSSPPSQMRTAGTPRPSSDSSRRPRCPGGS